MLKLLYVNKPTKQEWEQIQASTNLASKASGGSGDWTMNEIKKKAKKNNFENYLIVFNDKIIGAVQVNPKSNWITNFGINPKFQNKGYGRQCLLVLIEILRKKRKELPIRIGTAQNNQRAKHLYTSLGFSLEYEDKQYINYILKDNQ